MPESVAATSDTFSEMESSSSGNTSNNLSTAKLTTSTDPLIPVVLCELSPNSDGGSTAKHWLSVN